ncbi:MAG: hypothetical protein NTW19_01835 [Planctomycetota bacterium]|nr:hypothetical protein [Planctomycetota bacterium]
MTLHHPSRAAASAPLSIALLAFGLFAILAVGCQSSPYPDAGRADMMPPGTYPRNVMMDGVGEGVVLGEATVTAGTADKPIKIQQPVRNILDYPINIQYHFEFFDASRRLVGPDAGWVFKALPPKAEVFLEGSALQTTATDWRLQIRSAR